MTKYDGRRCGCCSARTRRMFEPGRGKTSRIQHPKWWVCENGHKQYQKRGQAG